MRGQAHPGGAVLAAAASPLGPRWCDTQKAQAAFSSGSASAAPGSLSCLSLLPLLFHIHFLSLSQSFPLFGA